MIVGVALLAFLLCFLPVLMVQRALADSAVGLVLASLLQALLSAVAIWIMLSHTDERLQHASGLGAMISRVVPGIGSALVANGMVGLWLLFALWRRGRA